MKIKGVLEMDLRERQGWRLFLIGVYYPPAGSARKDARLERTQIKERLPERLAKLPKLGQILMAGDPIGRVADSSNAREWLEMEAMEDEAAADDLDKDGLLSKSRDRNEDYNLNSNGEEILSWAKGADLWILNGRILPNTCTYFAKQGKSNCDTWLGSEGILKASVKDEVGEL